MMNTISLDVTTQLFTTQLFTTQLLIGCALAAVVAVLAYRVRALSMSGAIAAFVTGAVLFGLGGLTASLVLLTFFVTGSLLSRLPERAGGESRLIAEESGPRTARQVIANGLGPVIGVVAFTLRPDLREPTTLFFYGCLATATADTWATELGTRFGKRAVSVVTLRPVVQGESGGVSGVGLLASGGGALAIALYTLTLLPFSQTCGLLDSPAVRIVTIAGFAGALLDSVLGATVQARYRCVVCGSETESRKHCGSVTICKRGVPYLDNSAVNLLTTLWGGVISVGLSAL